MTESEFWKQTFEMTSIQTSIWRRASYHQLKKNYFVCFDSKRNNLSFEWFERGDTVGMNSNQLCGIIWWWGVGVAGQVGHLENKGVGGEMGLEGA